MLSKIITSVIEIYNKCYNGAISTKKRKKEKNDKEKKNKKRVYSLLTQRIAHVHAHTRTYSHVCSRQKCREDAEDKNVPSKKLPVYYQLVINKFL